MWQSSKKLTLTLVFSRRIVHGCVHSTVDLSKWVRTALRRGFHGSGWRSGSLG